MLTTSYAATDSQRWRSVEVRMRELGHRPEGLIEVLHSVQEAFGHLPPDAMARVAASLRVPLSTVYGVATFYEHFTLRPYGRHVCEVCTGTACHISGGEAVLAAVQDHLGTAAGTTTADGRLTLLTVRCPGLCNLAPVMVLDGVATGRITGEDAVARLEAL
jgi:bidirectional [NiFe] hydrogenase diaphorase subunit